MKVHRYFSIRPAGPASTVLSLFFTVTLFLITLFLTACPPSQQQSQPSRSAALESKAANTESVFVVFEGPWAVVDDPKDANSVLVLAPKTTHHRGLYVAASNEAMLVPGVYDLSVPAHGAPTSGALDPGFAQAKIKAASLQHALDDKSGRYVIRLPTPEAYVHARRFRSRVGSSYPPDASTEQDYATSVSFRYTVSNLNGFSLAGSRDTGSFTTLPLQVETPSIRFAIEPAQPDDPKDKCNQHSREAFRDTVKFLGLTLYVDFPTDSADCHKIDPQNARLPAEATSIQTAKVAGRMIASRSAEFLGAIDGADPAAHYLTAAAVYLFHFPGDDCRAAIVFLTITP